MIALTTPDPPTTLRGLTQAQVDALNHISHLENFIILVVIFTAIMVTVAFLLVVHLVDR